MFRHLDDAVLRRYIDEPDALLSYEKQHLVQCVRCRRTLDAVRSNARSAEHALNDAEEQPDIAAARAAVLERAQRGVTAAPLPHAAWRPVRTSRWISAVAAAAVLAFIASYAPFRAYAANFLTIFEPRELAPITVTRADMEQLHGLPELNELGAVKETGSHTMQRFSSLAAAAQYAHQPLLRPAYLPSSVPRSAEYEVHLSQTLRFTFDERKAKATAARKHFTLPAPPEGLDGSTLTAEVAPIVIESYGANLAALHGKHRVMSDQDLPRDAVIVAQSAVPAVHATSVSADTMESYLLSLPNIPQDVKSQLRAIRDPASTFPIPVIADRSTAKPVTIAGARGLLIGDNTGIGSVVVWVSNGRIYSVAGGFTADEITKVANSMTRE